MYSEDIDVSIAYSNMLSKIGVLTLDETNLINSALEDIRNEIKNGTFKWDKKLEDIHLNIENSMYDKIGEVAGKLHFGRSRNDQVATDSRLYFIRKIDFLNTLIIDFLQELVKLSEKNISIMLPGYTHLQKGQPILISHNLMSYFSIISRDLRRFLNARNNLDNMPLGSGAFAGVTIPIDREYLASELGFSNISNNSIDGVSSRDHILDILYSCSSIMINLSRISEELIIWNSEEFDFVNIPDEFTTGSSIMPQKRNPDYLELIRGKTGHSLGQLVNLATSLKGLTFTYNRDLQEDRKGAMDSIEIVTQSLEVIKNLFSKISFNEEKMIDSANKSNILATDFADYLANKKIPYREAYKIIKDISLNLKGKYIHELSLDELRQFSKLFEKDALDISLRNSIENRNSTGGTSTNSVRNQIIEAKNFLKKNKNAK
tara:strand:+ start:9830 stop:11125 length:1296 start_codon:yes stop_codon:yes gene_type:complete